MQEKKDSQPKSASSLGKVGRLVCGSLYVSLVCVFAQLCLRLTITCLAVFMLLNKSQRSKESVGSARVLMCMSVCVWLCWRCHCVVVHLCWVWFFIKVNFEARSCSCVVMHTYTTYYFFNLHKCTCKWHSVFEGLVSMQGIKCRMNIQCLRISFYLGCQCWSLWCF